MNAIGALVTLASGALLLAAFATPGGNRSLYLASALSGSVWIWWNALRGILRRDFTADIPVSVATAAALAIGEFPAAAVVAVLLLVGGLLESAVAARAEGALESLARLLPDRVTVRRDGRDLEIPAGEVLPGDLVLVRPGERVPVDGTVVSGGSSVDQAALTGESVPAEKGAGDTVFAGSLNGSGAFEVRADRVGEETAVGQIRRMVAEARRQKAPVERLLDRYAKLYTPAALVLGALLWWWSGDVLRAITMLIVFCPCVMVLATPAALVASIGNAALRGSLVKKGAVIEALAGVDAVMFDKTGTLTLGRPRLVEAVPLDGVAEAELLRLAATAERRSEHPVGRALVEAAEARGIAPGDPHEFEALPGLGVRARENGRAIVLAPPSALPGQGIALAPHVADRAAALAEPGRTVVAAAVGGRVAGLLVLEDALRPEAAAAVEALRGLGLHPVLVTGDHRAAAARIAAAAGIREVHAEVLPQHKAEIVKAMRARGRRVMFVGDGVNDGPALATADVGVAMGRGGADVAVESADAALVSDDLLRLPHLVRLSRRAVGVIRQNLLFSLGVLLVAVGMTAAGALTPVTGALVHELSSIPVILNSVRLIGARDR